VRLLASAVIVLAIAVAFMGAVVLRDYKKDEDGMSTRTTLAEPSSPFDRVTRFLAAEHHVAPEVMQERLDIAAHTCAIFKDVGGGYAYLSNVCRFNVVRGEPWWDDMPPRQLREVAEALIEATQ